jgi:amidase
VEHAVRPAPRDAARPVTRAAPAADWLVEITIRALQDGYASGRWTCAEVVESYLRRIDHAQSSAGGHAGIVALNPRARERAVRLDVERREGRPMGALHGVPVVVKDQFDSVDVPTAFGSRVVRPRLADADAPAVSRLRAAGAIVLATATMADLGLSLFSKSSLSGYTENPYGRTRDAGGSSSGCAAAVADNLCVGAIGMDSSGSVRLPASFTGLVGLRPTVGVVDAAGASPTLPVQDVPGPLARSVADVAALFEAMRRRPGVPEPADGRERSSRSSLHGLRIGFLRLPARLDLDHDAVQVEAITARAAVDLARLGAELVHVSPPRKRGGRRTAAAGPVIRGQLADYFARRPHFGVSSAEQLVDAGGADLLGLLAGPEADARTVSALLEDRVKRRAALVALLRRHGVDALCYPSAMLPAPAIADLESGRWNTRSFPALTWLAAQAGAPAITVPAGFTSQGLPVGLELLGAPLADQMLIRIAGSYERSTQRRRPPRPVA